MIHVDIIADFRGAHDTAVDAIHQWAREDPSAAFFGNATFVVDAEAVPLLDELPAGWRVLTEPIPAGLWDAVLTDAGRGFRAALTLVGAIQPGVEAAGVLLELLDADPMFGAVAAREQCFDGCCVSTLPGEATAAEWMPHAGIAELAKFDVMGDRLMPCMMLNTTLLADFGDTDPPFVSLAGAVLHRLASAQRCGFRTAVANRAVVTRRDADCARPPRAPIALPPADADKLRAFAGDSIREQAEYRSRSSVLFERLTSRHLLAVGGSRPSLLLDMRNVGATYNGTSFAALGAAKGLHKAADGWDVAIYANEEGGAFHDFESQFPGWTIYTTQPPPGFNVALRLSQPWHIQEMIDLHRVARLNAYLMLDTIAWDVVYVAPPYLDGTWQFLAATADRLLFISDFTRQRFLARFPCGTRTTDTVCHLSFDTSDYVRPEFLDTPESDYVLVIGNHLEHKDVPATAELLASAFPLMRIETLGPTRWRSPMVTTHKSGRLAEPAVHNLYAGAKLAIFPSFYEGFGLPVIAALAYGRTLLARESALLAEISGLCVPRGRLITYRQRDELVEQIGRLMNGEPVASRPLGTSLNGKGPRSWKDVGVQIEASLRDLMAAASTSAWQARDQIIAQVVAYRG